MQQTTLKDLQEENQFQAENAVWEPLDIYSWSYSMPRHEPWAGLERAILQSTNRAPMITLQRLTALLRRCVWHKQPISFQY